MPIYEFRCKACGSVFEALRRVGDAGEGLTCPRCEASDLEKQFSVFASGVEEKGSPPQRSGSCGGGGFS